MIVLILEDDRDSRETLASIITERGHEVVATERGKDAIRQAKTGRYDLLIADIGLPDVDGWTVARMTGRYSPRTRVWLVTGWSCLVKRDDFQTLCPGLRGVVKKPFGLPALDRMLADAESAKEGCNG